ncbi:MAG: hypothetical protein COZ21_14515 [Bacteroidetes bacterium CG_4_10_14_3_um_filter_31_20]|nr:MAG: hypothetical protein COZ21_14515 [Bacteroidetes bacterium CG_4_10_14_3_um_filter_31_20]
MNEENINNKIFELLGENPDRLVIIEENIPIKVQMEYFDYANLIRKENNYDNILKDKKLLFLNDTSLILKKEILSKLACLALPEAYRTIEKYLQLPDKKLINWAKLALFESKMLLESSLLDQSHVLISSGLGGKNNMLRYFIVVYLKNEFSFDATKKKVVVNEFDSVLKKNNCETELLKFYNKYFTLTALIPLNVNLKHTFSDAINECNEYGNFLVDSFIVTNVKKLTISEINSLFDKLNNNVNEQSC